MILGKEHTVRFKFLKKQRQKQMSKKSRPLWTTLSRKFYPATGAYKTRLGKKFTKCKLGDVTRNTEE